MNAFSRNIVIAGLACLLASAAGAQQSPAASGSEIAATSGTADTPGLQTTHYPRYVIQRQDVLLVTFPLSPELNQTITVQPDGYVSLRSAGSVHVQGLTVPEMTLAVKKAYAGVLHDPIVNVDLEDFQKPMFTVSGQVARPGQYELRADLTLSQAIAVAGGLAPTAKSQVFLFHKTPNGWFKVEKFDLGNLMNGKNVKEDAEIGPGDMIVIPESAITKFRKYVPYSVSAGTYFQTFPN